MQQLESLWIKNSGNLMKYNPNNTKVATSLWNSTLSINKRCNYLFNVLELCVTNGSFEKQWIENFSRWRWTIWMLCCYIIQLERVMMRSEWWRYRDRTTVLTWMRFWSCFDHVKRMVRDRLPRYILKIGSTNLIFNEKRS